ncbi:hypothetical protein DIM_16420 [Candidatus Denitrolinea symbiosum]|nr:hypothetical protein DIM_16420 [Candidatus Denitrolinea symbiosum]
MHPVWAIISLGDASPRRSSGLPGTDEETGRLLPSEDGLSLLGLAPGGGCLAARITADAGGLLRRLFTIATPAPPSPKFCGFGGGLGRGWQSVSVARSGGF